MSARPRFRVRELEGFAITLPLAVEHSSSHRKPSLQVLVLDTASAWRVVASWDTAGLGGIPRERRFAEARAAAATTAARLNAWAAAA